MINSIGATKRKLGDEINWEEKTGKATHPAAGSYSDAALHWHDSGVVKGPADGKIPVKGHDAKVEALVTPEREEEVELCKTTHEGDGLA